MSSHVLPGIRQRLLPHLPASPSPPPSTLQGGGGCACAQSSTTVTPSTLFTRAQFLKHVCKPPPGSKWSREAVCKPSTVSRLEVHSPPPPALPLNLLHLHPPPTRPSFSAIALPLACTSLPLPLSPFPKSKLKSESPRHAALQACHAQSNAREARVQAAGRGEDELQAVVATGAGAQASSGGLPVVDGSEVPPNSALEVPPNPTLEVPLNSASEVVGSVGWERSQVCLQDVGGPNQVVLEAQAKVCTGPTQTRPLEEEQLREVLETIIASAEGELPEHEKASHAQMGAFFGAMTLRANAFPESTTWQEGERRAMHALWPRLRRSLPQDVLFLADPEGALFDSIPRYTGGDSSADVRLVTALREMLAGGHLGFEESLALLREILPLKGASLLSPERVPSWNRPSDALVAAYLICQRMNRETDRELKAACLAFSDELGPAPVAGVPFLTHYGEPYDGSNRFFRPTLFVAAVRASYRQCCLLHGVPWMPPKGGVTEEKQLELLGANTCLQPQHAAALLEDPDIGFAYLSQRECNPSLYSLLGMRLHIKKRPVFATTEKVQRYVHARGKEAMVAGFYHEGYEAPLLMLMRRLPLAAGLVIKGEEGSSALMTRPSAEDASKKGRPVNFCAGFRPLARGGAGYERNRELQQEGDSGVFRERFATVLDAQAAGIVPSLSPRISRSAEKNLKLGMAALSGERGPAYDRIVFNAAAADCLLGCSSVEDLRSALERARDAIDSGRAILTLLQYVEESNKLGSE